MDQVNERISKCVVCGTLIDCAFTLCRSCFERNKRFRKRHSVALRSSGNKIKHARPDISKLRWTVDSVPVACEVDPLLAGACLILFPDSAYHFICPTSSQAERSEAWERGGSLPPEEGRLRPSGGGLLSPADMLLSRRLIDNVID
jgi:hypothetical protein